MLSLSSMTSFIELVGAFNFANVYSSFQDRFFKHILDVDQRFVDAFHEIEASIISMKESRFETLELKDGRSNESAARKLQEECDSLIMEEESIRESASLKVEDVYRMKYSQPLFVFCGLYSTFLLLAIGLMDMFDKNSICSSVALYNLMSWVVILYFVLCEVLKHFSNIRFMSLTKWGAIKLSLVLPIIPLVNFIVVECFGVLVSIKESFINYMIASGVALTFSGFFITIIATSIYYKMSCCLIKKETNLLKDKYKKLDDKKKKLDDIAQMFSAEIKFE